MTELVFAESALYGGRGLAAALGISNPILGQCTTGERAHYLGSSLLGALWTGLGSGLQMGALPHVFGLLDGPHTLKFGIRQKEGKARQLGAHATGTQKGRAPGSISDGLLDRK